MYLTIYVSGFLSPIITRVLLLEQYLSRKIIFFVTQVLSNPFDDIEPRRLKSATKEADKEKKKVKSKSKATKQVTNSSVSGGGMLSTMIHRKKLVLCYMKSQLKPFSCQFYKFQNVPNGVLSSKSFIHLSMPYFACHIRQLKDETARHKIILFTGTTNCYHLGKKQKMMKLKQIRLLR